MNLLQTVDIPEYVAIKRKLHLEKLQEVRLVLPGPMAKCFGSR